jgi:activator of HSP90 ATPase
MSCRTGWAGVAGQPDRRRMLLGAAVALGCAAAGSADAWAAESGVSHTAEAIHQEPVFSASRQRVYQVLTDAKAFDRIVQLSGALKSGALGNKPTEISPEVGGAFTIFGGHIIGRHLELVAGERIVQGWRVVDWDPGVYSIARFQLIEQGAGTKLVFDHTGFPRGLGQHLAEGWQSHYWEPLEKYLA